MKPNQPDYILLSVIAILVVFGLIMVSSASVGLSQERFGESYYYLKSQLLKGVLPGLFLGLIAYFLPYRYLKPLALPALIATIIALIMVFVPGIGQEHGGANRWIKIGPLVLQPTEFLKLSFIIYLSAWLSSKGKAVKDFSQGLIPFLFIVGAVALLIIKEPDIGTLGVIGFSSVIIYFLAGARISHLGIIGFGSVIAFYLLTKFYAHAASRLQVFMNPELDPKGIGYQINQAALALGSGGFFGVGLGQGLQKFKYLPEPASDSIVAVIGEELGFMGIMAVLLLFLIFTFRGLKVAQGAPDDFGRLLAGGLTAWVVVQALINIAAICGLIPLTGITLPFISLGGSSLAITLAGMGILLNISKYSKI
ncbi:MAG TPA: putative lipid II flippase FtsW [Candidatus Portnoybacteria bacterium]|nr:putative lipid II flippase FtsW [Candidatus Portnoybacteria bacterium]